MRKQHRNAFNRFRDFKNIFSATLHRPRLLPTGSHHNCSSQCEQSSLYMDLLRTWVVFRYAAPNKSEHTIQGHTCKFCLWSRAGFSTSCHCIILITASLQSKPQTGKIKRSTRPIGTRARRKHAKCAVLWPACNHRRLTEVPSQDFWELIWSSRLCPNTALIISLMN